MPTKHKWKFKSYFRSGAYSWKGTAKASKRMKESVSEIKKVAKKDTSLSGEGAIELFVRLYPAVMHIDGSSGAIGSAINRTINVLMPMIINADWDMNTRGKWLEKLNVAIGDDGWGIFDELRDHWGELCVFEGLAHLWADRLIPTVKDNWSSEQYCHFTGTDMCLSCLVYTGRYDELKNLLALKENQSWFYMKFWALALEKQNKLQEALDYAELYNAQQKVNNQEETVNLFCESLLIKMGKIEEAYQKYGLALSPYGTNLNIYRGLCKKYPSIDKKSILLDCIENKSVKGKWFASAKNAGYLDIAIECAMCDSADPGTLLRASRDFADSDFSFALIVGVQGVAGLVSGEFYDPVTTSEVAYAFGQVEAIALKNDKAEDFKMMLTKEMLKRSCKAKLKDVVLDRLKYLP